MDDQVLKTGQARIDIIIDCAEMAKVWLTLLQAIARKSESSWFDEVVAEGDRDGEA